MNRYELQRKEADDFGKILANEFQADRMFIAACALYWAEGSKYGNLVFVNCDPDIHRIVKKGFFDRMKLVRPLKLVLYCHPECDVVESLKFWQKIYPEMTQFSAVYRRKKGESTRVAKWPFGMLAVKSGSLLRRTIQSAIDQLFACHV